MKRRIAPLFLRLSRDDDGAVMVLVALMIVALIGLGALAVDVGNLAYTQRRLQAVTDMAALAGAEVINCGGCATNSAITTANAYSGIAGAKNAQPDLTITMVSGYPKLKCLASTSIVCTGASAPNPDANAVMVQEQARVPFLLGQVFGFGTVTLTATSLAGKGGALPPMHIMIVLDNTGSMNSQDGTGANCGNIRNPTRIQCALAGIQALLAELWPSQDEVGLIVFPPVNASTASNDTNCTASKTITPEPYSSYTGPSGSSVYQIVGLTSSYKASNGATNLTSPGSTSSLVNATCQAGATINENGVSGNCGSCQGNKTVGGEGTYLAGAITAAQSTLASNSATGVQNVIIVLSDGGAGNAANLWSSTTNQATAGGGTTLTMAATVPADVIPGTSVADNTTSSAIPAGTQVMSTSGNTVTLSSAVVSAATATTNAGTPPSSTTLHFAAVPSAVATGMAVSDQTHSSAIAACTTVVSKTSTTVTLSNAVVGTTAATAVTSAATAAGQTTLTFASLPGNVTAGMGVTDTTTSAAIPSGTTVQSISGVTVTISNTVGITGSGTTSTATTKSTTLTFNSLSGTVQTGMSVSGTGIPANTTVTKVSGTTVTISQQASVAKNTAITFSANSVAKGDTITFSTDVASGDTIIFGGVGCGDTISFGSNNQCHEAITAAQDAANAGTWVYSIAYGSYTQLSPNSNSCSDTETPPISSCTTMQDIANSPGVIPDLSKFYSDPMNVTPVCTSPDNPNATDITTIFTNLGFGFTSLFPNNTN
jgi:hypothetical protein